MGLIITVKLGCSGLTTSGGGLFIFIFINNVIMINMGLCYFRQVETHLLPASQ